MLKVKIKYFKGFKNYRLWTKIIFNILCQSIDIKKAYMYKSEITE